MGEPEPRCPSCNALVSLDADWCGQCYQPLRAGREGPAAGDGSSAESSIREGRPATGPPGEGRDAAPAAGRLPPLSATAPKGIERTETGTTWICPACGERNAIALNRCPACGTSFARVFEEPTARPTTTPTTTLIASLIVPGLGHMLAGRRGDGVARVILYAWLAGTVVVLAASRSGKGLGPVAPLFALFLLGAAVLWFESALDAYRLASDLAPVVSPRALLWASAAFVVAAAIVATIVALPATPGR